jgi:hypothetical protein
MRTDSSAEEQRNNAKIDVGILEKEEEKESDFSSFDYDEDSPNGRPAAAPSATNLAPPIPL